MDSPGIRHIVANVPDYEYMSPIGKPAFQLIGDTSVLVAHPSGPDIRFPLRVPPSPAYTHQSTQLLLPLPLSLCFAVRPSPPLLYESAFSTPRPSSLGFWHVSGTLPVVGYPSIQWSCHYPDRWSPGPLQHTMIYAPSVLETPFSRCVPLPWLPQTSFSRLPHPIMHRPSLVARHISLSADGPRDGSLQTHLPATPTLFPFTHTHTHGCKHHPHEHSAWGARQPSPWPSSQARDHEGHKAYDGGTAS